MTEQDRILLDGFKVKIKHLMTLFEQLKTDKHQLEELAKQLKAEINRLKIENDVLAQKYDNLKLAKSLLVPDNETQEAKSRINKIVREIDKCIAMLNQ